MSIKLCEEDIQLVEQGGIAIAAVWFGRVVFDCLNALLDAMCVFGAAEV